MKSPRTSPVLSSNGDCRVINTRTTLETIRLELRDGGYSAETQARAQVAAPQRAVDLVEGPENFCLIRLRDADAAVGDRELQH